MSRAARASADLRAPVVPPPDLDLGGHLKSGH